MAYTTLASIQLRLQGWATTQAPQAFGVTQVSDQLIELLIDRVSARIDACLRHIYTVPVPATSPIFTAIASCAEKLVMCELIGQLYAGQSPSENGSYGALMCNQGEKELECLLGHDEGFSVLPDGAIAGSNSPCSGTRSLPSTYRAPCPTHNPQIDPIRW